MRPILLTFMLTLLGASLAVSVQATPLASSLSGLSQHGDTLVIQVMDSEHKMTHHKKMMHHHHKKMMHHES